MRSFDVPAQYRSPLVSAIKNKRKEADKLKKDFSPTELTAGNLTIFLARHFGFCYGVENAIEIAFRAIKENPGKRIYLLSEMIHNPGVNQDLAEMGVKFLMNTHGSLIMDMDKVNNDDIVIIPAFGTTLETEQLLRDKGIDPTFYETTCPFVEKVWNRAARIGEDGYTIVIHGKPGHEETRATFSHASVKTATVVVKDIKQAILLGRYITGELPAEQFTHDFAGQHSEDFNILTDLQRIGVVNQTTMLASETQEISEYLKKVIITHFKTPENNISERFADTRDTLCYATNDNQSAVSGMLQKAADFALIIGGHNSSNTTHLAELCEQRLPTYFIKDEYCLNNDGSITHFNFHQQKILQTSPVFGKSNSFKIMVSSGASCPDALVERVINRLTEITGNVGALDFWNSQWQA